MYGTLMGMTGLVSSKGRGPTPPPAGPAGKAKGCAAAAKAAKASKASKVPRVNHAPAPAPASEAARPKAKVLKASAAGGGEASLAAGRRPARRAADLGAAEPPIREVEAPAVKRGAVTDRGAGLPTKDVYVRDVANAAVLYRASGRRVPARVVFPRRFGRRRRRRRDPADPPRISGSRRLDAGCHLIEMCTGKLVTYERKKAFLIAYESGGKKKQRGRGVATKPPRGASSARARTIATPAARERSLDRARASRPSRRGAGPGDPAAPPPPPPEPEASSPGWASSILEGLSMSWDSDVAAEAVSEAAPAVDDASSDDEGDAPPGPPRSRRELECRSEAASSDRSVAAETITQGALVRAKTADEITRSLREASARDLLSHPDESEVWAADLERVLHHARGAKSPDPRGLTVVRHNKGGGVFASPSTHTVLCADGSSHDVVLQRVKLGELVGRPYHILEDAATPPPSPTRPPASERRPTARRASTRPAPVARREEGTATVALDAAGEGEAPTKR
ncbi:hypothetical protein JL721_4089 [Aureococcus anophagefferens]|nr:hypothetical protein JL721_4089 [Aureococcus anophagefferens]